MRFSFGLILFAFAIMGFIMSMFLALRAYLTVGSLIFDSRIITGIIIALIGYISYFFGYKGLRQVVLAANGSKLFDELYPRLNKEEQNFYKKMLVSLLCEDNSDLIGRAQYRLSIHHYQHTIEHYEPYQIYIEALGNEHESVKASIAIYISNILYKLVNTENINDLFKAQDMKNCGIAHKKLFRVARCLKAFYPEYINEPLDAITASKGGVFFEKE